MLLYMKTSRADCLSPTSQHNVGKCVLNVRHPSEQQMCRNLSRLGNEAAPAGDTSLSPVTMAVHASQQRVAATHFC